MRLFSTNESAAAGVPSVLAIVETLVASAVLVWLSLHYNTARWLAVAVCLAPLTLLRTEDSVRRGQRWNEWLGEDRRFGFSFGIPFVALWLGGVIAVWRAQGWGWGLGMIPLGIVPAAAGAFALICFFIRCEATLVSILRHPLASAAAIPENWRRLVLATDSATDPEFLPGNEAGPLSGLKVRLREDKGLMRAFWVGVTLLLYPVTAAYRWSVKATCLLYTPLLWLAAKLRWSPPDAVQALRDYRADFDTVARVVLTLFLLAFFAAKVVLFTAVNAFAAWCEGTPGLTWLSLLIAPGQIPPWHVAAAGNSVLFLLLWRYSWKQTRISPAAPPPDPARVLRVWRTLTALSVVLSCYTIACHVAVLVQANDPLATLRALGQALGRTFWP